MDQEGAKGTTFAIARSVCLVIWETNRIAKDARGQITDPARKNINLGCLSSLGGAEGIHGVPPCSSCRLYLDFWFCLGVWREGDDLTPSTAQGPQCSEIRPPAALGLKINVFQSARGRSRIVNSI